MEGLNHIETRKKFDELCGFENNYVVYKYGIKEPLHAFKDRDKKRHLLKMKY